MIKACLVFDFDGTIADTTTPSPSGIDVPTASDLAVKEVLGKDAFDLYQQKLGGLQNRAPIELVRLILEQAKIEGVSVPQFTTDKEACAAYVTDKISRFNISKEWPMIIPGGKEFFQAVHDGMLPIETPIVSSGHDDFIKMVFEVNDIPLPKILVTSDTVQHVTQPTRELYKPHPYQLALAHHLWLGQRDFISSDYNEFTGWQQMKQRMGYVGDDINKDGGLSFKSRIPFVRITFTNPPGEIDPDRGQCQVEDFYELGDILYKRRDILENGGSMSEVLLGRPDYEVFPPLRENERPYQQWLEERIQGRGKEYF